MSCSIKEKLAQYYLNFRKNDHLYLFNKGMPKKAEKELLNFILNQQLNIEDEYHSYKLEGNKIMSFVFARKNNDEGEDTLVSEMIIQDNCVTKSMIKEEIAKIKSFYKDKYEYKKIIFVARSTQNKLTQLYNELEFEFTGYTYIGKVIDALKYYNNKDLSCPDGIKIRIATLQDLTKILQLGEICHGADQTSRIHNNVSVLQKEFSDVYKKSIKDKATFLIIDKSKIIGYLVTLLNYKNYDKKVLIGDIGVHPDHWGNGFANILYNKAFQFMKSKEIEMYLGTSSTKSVMNLSKKLNRKVLLSVYYINI